MTYNVKITYAAFNRNSLKVSRITVEATNVDEANKLAVAQLTDCEKVMITETQAAR